MSDFIDRLARTVALMEYRDVTPSEKQPFKMTFTSEGWRGTIWVYSIAASYNVEGDCKGLRVTYSLPLVSRTKFSKIVPQALLECEQFAVCCRYVEIDSGKGSGVQKNDVVY